MVFLCGGVKWSSIFGVGQNYLGELVKNIATFGPLALESDSANWGGHIAIFNNSRRGVTGPAKA